MRLSSSSLSSLRSVRGSLEVFQSLKAPSRTTIHEIEVHANTEDAPLLTKPILDPTAPKIGGITKALGYINRGAGGHLSGLNAAMKDPILPAASRTSVKIDTTFPGYSTPGMSVGFMSEVCPLEGWMMLHTLQGSQRLAQVLGVRMSDVLAWEWKEGIRHLSAEYPRDYHTNSSGPSLNKVFIFNTVNRPTSDAILKINSGNTLGSNGLDISRGQPGFDILLKTPIIRGVAWMLKDYADEFGGKVIGRIKVRPQEPGNRRTLHIQLELGVGDQEDEEGEAVVRGKKDGRRKVGGKQWDRLSKLWKGV